MYILYCVNERSRAEHIFNHHSISSNPTACLSSLYGIRANLLNFTSMPKFVIKSHSPYHLHPSKGPGALIIVVIFDGKNYGLWEKAIRTSLKSKNKLGFIDETIAKPSITEGKNAGELQAWEMVNSMISSWILNVIDPRLRTSVAYAESTQAMWSNLKKRYVVANTPKIHQLKASIAACKQGNLDVVEFYCKLSALWSELGKFVKIPHCTCTRCNCGAANKFVEMMEEEKSH